jgi:hypothetical protein
LSAVAGTTKASIAATQIIIPNFRLIFIVNPELQFSFLHSTCSIFFVFQEI